MAIVNLAPNAIYHGDSQELLERIEWESIALSIWSPPYYVGGDCNRGCKIIQYVRKRA